MLRVRRTLAAVTVGWAGAWAAGAAELRLPPIAGELSGTFKALKVPGAPALTWGLSMKDATDDRRAAALAIRGAGTKLEIEAEVDGAGDGRWKIVAGELDLAQWFPVAAPQLGEAASGVTASGVVVLTGEGELHGGQPSGTVKFVLEEAALRDAALQWSASGVFARGEFRISAGDAAGAAGPFELGIGTISTTRFGARNFFARGRLNENWSVTLAEARIEMAGGEVVVDPATIPLAPPSIDLNLRVRNVGLQDVAALAPSGFSDARGRIDGAVRIRWSEAEGFQVGVGHLTLGQNEPAVVRLAPSPGFLTDRVPQFFTLIPPWAGPLSRWLRPKNPAYADMEEIELGRTELRVHSLTVRLTPAGDERGRTASVQITAQPMQASSVVDRVTFEINVSGPLMHVLKLGLEQPFSLQVR